MSESRLVIEERSLQELADILREKSGTTQPMDIDEMIVVADGIGLPEQEELEVTENGEYTPESYGFSKVTVDVNPEREELNVTKNGEYIPETYGFSKVSVDVQPTLEELTVLENGVYTPTEYGYSKVTVDCPPPPPDEAFLITGDCSTRFAYGSWDWFLDLYSSKITTKDISSLSSMFHSSKCSRIPFVINIKDATTLSSVFNFMDELKECPRVRGTINCTSYSKPNFADMITYCRLINNFDDLFEPSMLNEIKDITITSSYSSFRPVAFQNCQSLRTIPEWWYEFRLNPASTAFPSNIYTIYYYMVYGCWSLDEINNIPVWNCNAPLTSNVLSAAADTTYRLKDFTFETNDGEPIVAQWKSQTIDLTKTGNWPSGNDVNLSNSGITTDKFVDDQESYDRLKNDPDWYSGGQMQYEDNKPIAAAYSRYDHDSAVRTINSLPDTSAYLATAGGTNTIKFNKYGGWKTDAGPISNLTAEEIAVATAKGWTVTLS